MAKKPHQYDETNGQLQTSIEVAIKGKRLESWDQKIAFSTSLVDSMGRLWTTYFWFWLCCQNELEEQQLEEFAYNSHGQILLAKNAIWLSGSTMLR